MLKRESVCNIFQMEHWNYTTWYLHCMAHSFPDLIVSKKKLLALVIICNMPVSPYHGSCLICLNFDKGFSNLNECITMGLVMKAFPHAHFPSIKVLSFQAARQLGSWQFRRGGHAHGGAFSYLLKLCINVTLKFHSWALAKDNGWALLLVIYCHGWGSGGVWLRLQKGCQKAQAGAWYKVQQEKNDVIRNHICIDFIA